MKKKQSMLLTNCIVSLFIAFASTSHAGVWLSIEKEGGFSLEEYRAKLNWLDQQNQLNKTIDPWMGMRIFLTWGEIPYVEQNSNINSIQYDFSHLVDILNASYYRGENRRYQVALTISDKYWEFSNNNDKYTYTGGALPKFYIDCLGGGTEEAWSALEPPEGSVKKILINGKSNCVLAPPIDPELTPDVSDYYRFAVGNSNTISNAARKYSAIRWNEHVQALWFDFWDQLANYEYTESGVTKKLKDHPALYSIITPESSIAGINHNKAELEAILYEGASAYANRLLGQAGELGHYFDKTRIISSINWISEKADTRLAPYYQQYLGDELSALNENVAGTTVLRKFGWHAQDLRLDETESNNSIYSYEDIVYPEFTKFDRSLTYAMITGDTYKKSAFGTDKTKAKQLLLLANNIGAGHLLFLKEQLNQDKDGTNKALFKEIASANKNDYSFLNDLPPLTPFKMESAVVYDGNYNNVRRIVVTTSGDVGHVSENGFHVTVNGNTFEINNVQRHSVVENRILINLVKRVFSGDTVSLQYNELVEDSVTDVDGNRMDSEEITIDNRTSRPRN